MEEKFDYTVLDQKPNYWLPTHIVYEGEGSAEFQNPKGRVYGTTTVVFDEFGEFFIEMKVEGLESEKPLPLGLDQLISAYQPKEENGKLMLTIPPSKYNLCTRLSVRTSDGEFIAQNIEWMSASFSWNRETGQSETLRFFPDKSYFDTSNSSDACFWVMPLVNFVSKFMQYDASLGNHPLRIYPDATVPPGIPEERKSMAEHMAKQKSRLILFEFDKRTGFIEALPDYEEKEERLLKRQIPSAITSVMVGNLATTSIDLDEVLTWFPLFMLDLLGLASGNQVGTPWLEFRDQNGRLVRRIHASFGFRHSLFLRECFLKGRVRWENG